MKKPSVVFLNRVYPRDRGATGRMLRDLAKAFARDGWDVTVITTSSRSVRERDGSIRIVRAAAPIKSKSIFSYGWAWLRLLMLGFGVKKPDLIVTMTDPPLLVVAGQIIARMKGCKHMHWCQDVYPDVLPALGVKFPKFFMRFCNHLSVSALRKCDRIIVIGRCMAERLAGHGIAKGQMTLVPNWADAELVPERAGRRRPAKIPRAIAKATKRATQKAKAEGAKDFDDLFRDGDPKFRVLYSGNLGRSHPIDTVLEAIALLDKSHPEIEFVFVGDGGRYNRLARQRDKRHIQNMRFLPFQPLSRLKELMESGDLHLVTMDNRAEGCLVPCKIYSALAAERPCVFVGPETAEIGQVINDFGAGIVVRQGDPEQLAAGIAGFLDSGDKWYSAHESAAKAGRIYRPDESMKAWIERARVVAGFDKNLGVEKNKGKKAA